MGRSRYTITEPEKPHFLTCTVVEWLPVLSWPETVEILLHCWRYQRAQKALELYGYVVLENHCHFIAQAPNLTKVVSSFKAFTARKIIYLLKTKHAEMLLKSYGLPNVSTRMTATISFGRKAFMPNSYLITASCRKNSITSITTQLSAGISNSSNFGGIPALPIPQTDLA